MRNYSRRVILIIVLSGILVGCRPEEKPLTIGEAIQGDYGVAFYDHISEKTIQAGTLNIENGEYTFTPQVGVDIPNFMVDRFYFISNPEGLYELSYRGSMNGEDIFVESENLDTIATISFQGPEFNGGLIHPLNLNFLVRYGADSENIYFHSTVSELQRWGVHKIE